MRYTWLTLAVFLGCRSASPHSLSVHFTYLAPPAGDVGRFTTTPIVSSRLADGSFFITEPWGTGPSLPEHFDSAGRSLGPAGREGSGPGEYRGAQLVLIAGDTAIIFDSPLRRASVLVNGQLLRTFPTPFPLFSALRLHDGTFVASRADVVPGPSLYHLTSTGGLIRGFGDSVGPADLYPYRLLAAAPDGSFWSARPDRRCELRHWRSPGTGIRTLELCSGWFEPYQEYRGPSPEAPPSPTLRGLWEDADHHLWIVGQIPDSQFAQGLGKPMVREGHAYFPAADPQRVFDGLIAVYDTLGRVIATHRQDAVVAAAPEPGLIIVHTTDSDGWIRPERALVTLAPEH